QTDDFKLSHADDFELSHAGDFELVPRRAKKKFLVILLSNLGNLICRGNREKEEEKRESSLSLFCLFLFLLPPMYKCHLSTSYSQF
ncbi:unnamed protein product, partial [Arabidopsis halleri]